MDRGPKHENRRPAAPSRRVYIAFGVAAAVGLAVFLIWWGTTRRPPAEPPAAAGGPSPQAAGTAPPALFEEALPRGGALTVMVDDLDQAAAALTAAPLVRVNRSSNQVEAWLAESWTASADNLTYTLTLRPSLVWSDGEPLRISDVVDALGNVRPPGMEKPLAVRAIDGMKIEIAFPEPFAPALRVLDRHPVAPRKTPAGVSSLGPFVEAQDRGAPAKRGARRFVRNPHYWRKTRGGAPLPFLDEITLLPSASSDVQADFADRPVPPDAIESARRLEQEGKARFFDLGPGLDADVLWFAPPPAEPGKDGGREAAPDDKPWLSSERFRLAVSMAVDRVEYCKQVFYGACEPLAVPVSSTNVEWFNPDLPVGNANAPVARTMLADLGLRDRNGDGLLDDAALRTARFSLLIRRGLPSAARAGTFLADTLKTIGVQVDVVPVDPAALRARHRKGDYEAIYDRLVVRDTDPAMNLDFWLSTGEAHVWAPRAGRPADWERQIDEFMRKNASSFDRIERLQAFVDAMKIFREHMPAVVFGAPHVRMTTSVRVLNASPSPLRPHVLWSADTLAALK